MELNTIYNIDCIEFMKQMPEYSVDLTVTSPPYDTMRLYQRKVIWNMDKFKCIANELVRITKNGGAIIWVTGDETKNHSESGNSFRQALYFMQLGMKLQDTMIFAKKNPLPGYKPTSYGQAFEYIFVLTKGVLQTFNPIMVNTHTKKTTYNKVNKWSKENRKTTSGQHVEMTNPMRPHYNIFEYAVGCEGVDHPAVFPIKLARDMIYTYSNDGDLIFDPFIGSGTVAIASIQLNRHFLGTELVSDYFKTAYNRIKNEMSQLSMF